MSRVVRIISLIQVIILAFNGGSRLVQSAAIGPTTTTLGRKQNVILPSFHHVTGSQRVLWTMQGSYHVWSEPNKYFACLMPKVGCSSWLKYIRGGALPKDKANESNSVENMYRHNSYPEHGLYFRGWTNPEEQQNQLETVLNSNEYFKFAVVRHPWDRIVSAYRSKFQGECASDNDCLRTKFHLPILERKIAPLSFHDFIIALSNAPQHSLNSHFKPMTLLCDLNRVRYDFIGTLGSVEDEDYISTRMGYPSTFSNVTGSKYKRNDKEYWGGRTNSVFECKELTVALVEQIYAADAAILGFSFEKPYHSCRKYKRTEAPLQDKSDPSSVSDSTANENENENKKKNENVNENENKNKNENENESESENKNENENEKRSVNVEMLPGIPGSVRIAKQASELEGELVPEDKTKQRQAEKMALQLRHPNYPI